MESMLIDSSIPVSSIVMEWFVICQQRLEETQKSAGVALNAAVKVKSIEALT